MKNIGHKYVSIIGNFICTKENRLKVLKEQVPVMSKLFSDYNFYINYNTTINLGEVKSLFENNVKNLYFTNDLSDDWGSITASLVEKSETPYVFYMLEDYVYNYKFDSDYIITDLNDELVTKVDIKGRKEFWEKMIIEAFVDGDVKHMFLAKIKKYLPPSQFVLNSNYIERDYIYTYLAKDSPTGVYSRSAIHDKDILLSLLKQYAESYTLPTPGQFEQRSEIMRKFDDLICAIPKEQIVIQTHLEGDTDR